MKKGRGAFALLFGGVCSQYTYLSVFECIGGVLEVYWRCIRRSVRIRMNTQPNTLDTMYQSVDVYWMRWGAVIHRQYKQILEKIHSIDPRDATSSSFMDGDQIWCQHQASS